MQFLEKIEDVTYDFRKLGLQLRLQLRLQLCLQPRLQLRLCLFFLSLSLFSLLLPISHSVYPLSPKHTGTQLNISRIHVHNHTAIRKTNTRKLELMHPNGCEKKPTTIGHQGMQIKPTANHSTPRYEWLKLKSLGRAGFEKINPLHIADENRKWSKPFGKYLSRHFLK